MTVCIIVGILCIIACQIVGIVVGAIGIIVGVIICIIVRHNSIGIIGTVVSITRGSYL